MTDLKKPKIGFIGQGFIGKNYADDFEKRGFTVIRFAKEEPYHLNEGKIKEADIVFVAVPTPSTPDGFDDSILRSVMKYVGKGKTVVIKSTILPGTVESIQTENPDIFVMHSPEFLTEATAEHDAGNPNRNIIGIPTETAEYQDRAKQVLSVLPKASFEVICKSKEAELIKYAGNNWLYLKVVYVNMLYDLAMNLGCEWDTIRDAMSADPRIGKSHLMPVHVSGTLGSNNGNEDKSSKDNGLRGAGGHCFIKDFAAFRELYARVGDEVGNSVLKSLEDKNIDLLKKSKKDLDLLAGVYGEDINK
ncbi:hypothetical protein COB55_00250 [Candidatus Wolfebacteria bacterium]|nr:MAG: hypothetical protein COB55_00250 [Candidatus Wolfebacteria bacterium]